MMRWIGPSLIGIGVFHTILGGMLFAEPWQAIVLSGVWNSLGIDPLRHAAFWFMVDGIWVILLGLVVDWLEVRTVGELPKCLGWGLLVLAIGGIVILPISGVWLLLPVAIGSLRRVTSRSPLDDMPIEQ